MEIKICVAMITFNSDFVLKQVIESIYPYVEQIIIVDGCVKYWTDKGFTKSTDETYDIIHDFDDYENKITYLNEVAKEKTELCQKFMPFVNSDTTHLWCLDSDEVFKPEDIFKIKNVLRERNPNSIGFKSNTFFGGFDYILGGFEKAHSFKRLLKYQHGCTYVDHRPPTLSIDKQGNNLHISGQEMSDKYGVEMYHYSYVSPTQVFQKIQYYESAVISKGKCIPNYFNDVFIKWVTGCDTHRALIEKTYNGVHEFTPDARGECKTELFRNLHPEIIFRDIKELKAKFDKQLKEYL